ncbi:hypothetical protein Tco_1335391 [Tanacetum coccineum]
MHLPRIKIGDVIPSMFDSILNPPGIRRILIPNVAHDPVYLQAEAIRSSYPFAAADPEPFVNVFALDFNSEASSSGEINILESSQSPQHHEHVRKWTDYHPLDNIIGNPSRPVSTRKQLATDALWCFYNSVLSKVEPKNFQSAAIEDCWFQAMQDEIYEFDRLDVWELVPPPDSAQCKRFRQEESRFEKCFARLLVSMHFRIFTANAPSRNMDSLSSGTWTQIMQVGKTLAVSTSGQCSVPWCYVSRASLKKQNPALPSRYRG